MIKLTIRIVALAILLFSAQVFATTITIVNQDGAGEGLNSNAAASPTPGNPATTLGQQYQNVFRAAADYWEEKLDSSVEIFVDARFDPLSCNANSGVLGAAGPQTAHGNFANVPIQNIWYIGPLANSLAGSDLSPGVNDVDATFNSSLNGDPNCIAGFRWWTGIDAPAPNNTISLFDTVLHEIGHGLGFLSLVDQNGVGFQGFSDAYSENLFDVNQNRSWSTMSNAQRASSSISNGSLVWSGANVINGTDRFTVGKNGGRLRMYAPNPYQQGSSVSHWDTVLSPDELMEPIATLTSDSCATILAMKDMGWKTQNECSGSRVTTVPIIPLLLDE